MHVDLTVFSDVMVALVLYYLLFFLLGIRHVPVPDTSDAQPPLVVIVVPARNEELVIEETTRLALSTSYRGPVRVLVVDDASSDATASLVADMAVGESRLRLLRRSPEFGGVGKSEVLNHAYAEITHWVHAEDPWLLGYTQHQIILGVIDADGHLSPGALNDVTAYFRSRRVGAVQISVHIREVAASCLARLQDIELVGYSYMTQTARDRLGSVGLGGNGQFMRLSALASLGPLPWHPGALTEDLDLGIRMMIEGWHLRVCSLASVDQQGLSGFRPLLRQRTRWAQGAYQCWRLLPGLARSPKLWVATRVDAIARLLLAPVVVMVGAALVLEVLSIAGVVTIDDHFVPWMGSGIAYRMTVLILAWMPPLLSIVTYQRHARRPLSWWEVPAYTVLTAGYAYLWAVTALRAWVRFALGRGNWVKTPRLGTTDVALVSARGAE